MGVGGAAYGIANCSDVVGRSGGTRELHKEMKYPARFAVTVLFLS
jgi:hypothetical protein